MRVRTKLDSWCEGVLEAGWLAALVIAPLFFNVFSSRVFEPDKISLVRTIALVMLLAWVIKIVNGGPVWLPAWNPKVAAEDAPEESATRQIWRNPFFIPVALLIGAYLIGTIFSLAPFVSWFGSYQRLQGTYTFLSYVTIAMLTAGHLRSPEQVRRLQHTVVLTSLPIAIYGVVQHYQRDPLPWGGDTTTRVTSNAGNAIFLAAYLLMAFFYTVERIYSSFAALVKMGDNAPRGSDMLAALAGGSYLFIAMVQVLAIVWTQSRGPWLGIMLGSYVFVLLVLTALRPRAYKALSAVWVGLGVLGIVGIVSLNTLPAFQSLRTVPYVGRFTQLLDQESTTAQVRTLIWQGASDLVMPHAPLEKPDLSIDRLNAIRPLVGYGPEAMWVAFNKFYPQRLAQVEARNASPDRSHNETWDSLVITGLLGFIAYMAVFISVFYWALRWLGLLVNRRDTILFAALLAISSIALSVVFYFYDGGQLRYMGVAFPAGLMFGVVVYIMLAAFLHSDFRPVAADVPRQLLIIAILSLVLAHFVEIHFGIAIASTRTYFWVSTALLVALGLRWAQAQAISVALDVEEAVEGEAAPAAPAVAESAKGRKTKVAAKPAARRAPQQPPPLTPLTVMTDALIFLTAVFLYTTNSRGIPDAFSILWSSVTQRVEGGAVITSPAILYMLLFTWLVAVLLGTAAEALRRRELPPASWWVKAVLVHAAIVWGTWLVYGLIQGARVAPVALPTTLSATEQLNRQLDRVAGHFAVFTWVLIAWIVVAGTVYAWRAIRLPKVAFARRPLVSALAGALTALAVFVVVSFVNVGLVRADIIYKQGQQFDSQRNWVNSIELYRRALAARETEDHYMLFLGRALLEQAKVVQSMTSTSGFPEKPALADVLALSPEETAALGRLDLLRAAEAVLLQAQRINPLNTDHTANLARLYRTWADLSGDDTAMRQEMLDKSIDQYNMAITLSPQAAHLWNEKGNAHLARGERPEAEQAYLKSLSLDELFEQTYLLLSDFYEAEGTPEALAKAAAILEDGIAQFSARRGVNSTLQLNSYLGVILSRSGEYTGAIQAMGNVLEIQPNNQVATRNLALLYRDAGNLPMAAQQIEQALALVPADQTSEVQSLQALALEIYQKLMEQQPDDYQAPLAIARILQAQGRSAEALTFAQTAAANAPESERTTVDQFIASLGG